MKKQTKLWMVPCAAAAFTMGMSMMSFAATGWQEEGGTWRYYDNGGSLVTDSWKKSGNDMFYLDSNGEMAKSQLIDHDGNYYYVNSSGAMVKNQWREIANEDDYEEDAPESYWYYFQTNGRAYKAGDSGSTSFKSIKKADGTTKKYAFDPEGRMLFGWVGENSERVTGEDAWRSGVYYCGDSNDGAQLNNTWAELDVVDNDIDKIDFNDKHWFYFQSNGKKVKDAMKTINGRKYQFDEDGAAEYDWYERQIASTSTASGSTADIYYNDQDQRWQAKGWFNVIPGPNVDEVAYENGDAYWFYAQNDGTLIKSQIKSINGQRYAFNEKGMMLHGLYKLTFDSANKIDSYEKIEEFSDMPGEDDASQVYYFGNSPKEGAMALGTTTIELDGEKYSYNFKKSGENKGAGVDGISNDMIHVKGRILKADRDVRYEVKEYKDKEYLVNTSGKIQKNRKNLKDADDKYYSTNAAGEVIYSGYEKQ